MEDPLCDAGWTGGLEDLAETFNGISKKSPELGPLLGEVNLRLLRHYQDQGALGRGSRQGKRKIYNSDDLRALIALRLLMADSWTLPKIAELLPGLSRKKVGEIMGVALTRQQESLPEAPSQGSAAKSLLRGFRAEAGLSAAQAAVPGTSRIYGDKSPIKASATRVMGGDLAKYAAPRPSAAAPQEPTGPVEPAVRGTPESGAAFIEPPRGDLGEVVYHLSLPSDWPRPQGGSAPDPLIAGGAPAEALRRYRPADWLTIDVALSGYLPEEVDIDRALKAFKIQLLSELASARGKVKTGAGSNGPMEKKPSGRKKKEKKK